MKHPKTTPIEEWSNGWLKMQIASILMEEGKDATYLIMLDKEKKSKNLPVTREEMIEFIKNKT